MASEPGCGAYCAPLSNACIARWRGTRIAMVDRPAVTSAAIPDSALTGSTSGYVSGPFTGKFGITLLSGPSAVPDRPRFGCDAEDLAPALP